jgi:hypothetical protein
MFSWKSQTHTLQEPYKSPRDVYHLTPEQIYNLDPNNFSDNFFTTSDSAILDKEQKKAVEEMLKHKLLEKYQSELPNFNEDAIIERRKKFFAKPMIEEFKKRLPHVVKSENEFFIRHQAPFNEVLKTDYDKLILGKEYGVLYEPSEDKHIDKIDKKENQGFFVGKYMGSEEEPYKGIINLKFHDDHFPDKDTIIPINLIKRSGNYKQDSTKDQSYFIEIPFYSNFTVIVPPEKCPICFEDINDDRCRKCENGHLFHNRCYSQAIQPNETKKCPICRNQGISGCDGNYHTHHDGGKSKRHRKHKTRKNKKNKRIKRNKKSSRLK